DVLSQSLPHGRRVLRDLSWLSSGLLIVGSQRGKSTAQPLAIPRSNFSTIATNTIHVSVDGWHTEQRKCVARSPGLQAQKEIFAAQGLDVGVQNKQRSKPQIDVLVEGGHEPSCSGSEDSS